MDFEYTISRLRWDFSSIYSISASDVYYANFGINAHVLKICPFENVNPITIN